MKKTLVLLGLTALVAAGAPGARAQGVDPIEMRQVGMDLVAGDYTGIRAIVAAKGDLKTLEGPAKAIQRFATVYPSLFPKGTETGHDTKAKPEIWSDSAGFQKASAAMGDAAGKLAVAARAGDESGVTAAVKEIGDACGACHRGYRAR
ncbi:MAG: cytochrome c [Rhodospirillales bacterium]|nr:cytochrome c [Rhodospirillales bacterium]